MLGYFLISCLLLLYAEGLPNDRHRFRRDEDVGGIVYAPCKDTYSQCIDWKRSGMCEMPQYKDYMPLVCTDTCGFCKVKDDPGGIGAAIAPAVAPAETAETPQDTTKVDASSTPDTAQKDRIQEDYETQLRKYYQNLENQQKEYQAALQPQAATPYTEPGVSNSAVSSPTTADFSPVVSAEAAPAQAAAAPAYSPYQSYGAPAYNSQPYSAYPYAPPATPEGGSSSSSSTQVGSSSSSSSSSSTDTSSGSSISVGSPSSALNGTETNISASDVASLPSKVAPETPSLPALPPLLALPPISESLLIDDSSKSNTSNSVVEKETSDTKAQQAADSKPYEPERTSSSKPSEPEKSSSSSEPEKASSSSEPEKASSSKASEPEKTISKNEGKKQKHKASEKTDLDRKVITEDEQTNEMKNSESKHLTASAHEPSLEDENDSEGEGEEEGGDQKMIKAFSGQPGKLRLSKKKKSLDSTVKFTKEQRTKQKSAKEEASDNEDAVFKHDEKSVSDGGSGASDLEESVEDLNYITDFNPDDFDMDVADISRKDLIRLHDKRNLVQFPENHPLFSRSGVQKARSEITAPRIIDATEDGVGDSTGTRVKSNLKTNVRGKHKSPIKGAKKEEVTKTTDESSGMPTEVTSKFFESPTGDADEDAEEDIKEEEAEKKNRILVDTVTKPKRKHGAYKKNRIKDGAQAHKNDATRKIRTKTHIEHANKNIKENGVLKRKDKITKHEESVKGDEKNAEKKSKSETKGKPTIGMKSKISINFKKNETATDEPPSKVVSTKNKIEERKDKTSVKKEKKSEKVDEYMSDKGDTAAVRNQKVVKKSNTATVKKELRHKVDKPDTRRKEIPKGEPAKKVKGSLKKRTNSDDKDDDGTEATIADLSGAGSGEMDTDMLSGDSPSRSFVEPSGDGESDEEEDDEEEEDEPHQRQNFQLHGDPEMVDLKPKETKEQPDLNDFPDDEDKASYAKGKQAEQTDAGTKNMSNDEAELDDIKIEELLNPKKDKKKRKETERKVQAGTMKLKEGKISMVLQQNFNVLYEKKDSPSYQMLAGNVKKDLEKMLPGTAVSEMTFSEVSVEGNPRQSGKTKVNFDMKAPNNEWMKTLLKLVDSGDIDGLRVIKGSLEIEEE